MCPGGYPIQESQNWQAGFLPGIYQGTYIDTQHSAIEKLIENIRNDRISLTPAAATTRPPGKAQSTAHRGAADDAQMEARIQSFELAFRMQTEAAKAFDVSREPQRVLRPLRTGHASTADSHRPALVERGVRFVQIWHGAGQPWDNHDDLEKSITALAKQCDQAIGALLQDFEGERRLDETLVIWGGEFGRTPTVELPTPGSNAGAKVNGRDHNHYGFTVWMAGGGVKGGMCMAYDEFGFRAVRSQSTCMTYTPRSYT